MSHSIIDKAIEDGWPVSELIEIIETFDMELQIVPRAEKSEGWAEQTVEVKGEELFSTPATTPVEARSRRKWTYEELRQVALAYRENRPVEEVAAEMGRSVKSIYHQYRNCKRQDIQDKDKLAKSPWATGILQ